MSKDLSESNNPWRLPIVVGERPLVLLGTNTDYDNLNYLRAFEVDYFSSVAALFCDEFEHTEDQGQRSKCATAIRSTYGHAIESLMAIIGAATQAPHGVGLWLNEYTLRDLRHVVSCVRNSTPAYFKLTTKQNQLTDGKSRLTWNELSNLVHSHCQAWDADKRTRISDGFASFWQRVSSDFMDEHQQREYNSIKHGVRVRPGGFTLRITPERTFGVIDESATSHISGGKYGTTYLTTELFNGRPKHCKRVRHDSVVWDPRALIQRLQLVSMSIQNIMSALRLAVYKDVKPDGTGCLFRAPVDHGAWTDCWRRPNTFRSRFSDEFGTIESDFPTKAEVLKAYSQGSW
ncbi:MAG: hypothetical protein NCW75_14110 [Phycisphaera sp.]|nr:MAG: hypothetical protein NCW75_14110 [Phycisphaera sp.]